MTIRAQNSRGLASPIRLAVLALCAGHAAANAQSAAAPAPSRAASANEASTTLQEVTVTATKRTTSLQSTPLAVTALNAATLEKEHVQTVQDIVHLVPSFQATTEGDHGVITMTLRGIGNDSAKTEYADPEVALFVDGVYAPRAEGAATLLFDMEGVEVLRGPQGTLWGRNSTVGAVNMQTAKAEIGSNFGNIEAGIGNYNRMGSRGAFNLSVSDTFALRVAAAHEQHEGYVSYQTPKLPSIADQQAAAAPVLAAYNASHDTQLTFRAIDPNSFVQSGPKYNSQDQTAFRLSALWKPIRGLTWNASYEKFEDHGTPNINLMQTPRDGEKFWSALISIRPYLERSVNTFRSKVNWSLNDDLDLVYTAGYSDYHGSSDYDQTAGAYVPTSFVTGKVQDNRTNWSHYKNYSHEVQLQSAGSHAVDWILGAYYAAEDNGIRFDIPIMNGTMAGTVGWMGSFIQPKETVASEAVFGQATWNLSNALHLTGGLRYTHDDRKNEGGIGWGWQDKPDALPQPIAPGTNPADLGDAFSPGHNDGHYTGHKATWLTRLNYDVAKGFLVYGSVSTGYKSGGVQDGGQHYGPETLTNYEVGTKNTLLDGAVHFNNSLYYSNFKDFQFSAPVTNPDGSHGLFVANAKGAKVYGLETELAAKITKDDTLQLTGAYQHTRLGYLLAGSNDYSLPACPDARIGTCLDVTGHELPHAPKFSGQALIEHTVRFGDGSTLAPRASIHYETATWLSVFNLGDGDRQKAYARADVGLRYQSVKDWYVDGYVQNVGDNKVKTNAFNANNTWQSQYLPPRTFGVNVGYNF